MVLHIPIVVPLINLGEVLGFQGDFATAQAHFYRALSIIEVQHGPEHGTNNEVWLTLWRVAKLNKQPEVAETAADRLIANATLQMQRATTLYGEQHIVVVGPTQALYSYLSRVGRHAQAEPLARRVVALLAAVDPTNDSARAAAQRSLGATLAALHRYDEAEPVLAEAFASAQLDDKGEVNAAAIELELAQIIHCRSHGGDARAEALALDAYSVVKRYVPDHTALALRIEEWLLHPQRECREHS